MVLQIDVSIMPYKIWIAYQSNSIHAIRLIACPIGILSRKKCTNM